MSDKTEELAAGGGLDRPLFLSLAVFSAAVLFSVTAVEGALFLCLAFLLAEKYRSRSLGALPRALVSHELFLPWAVYLGVCLLTALTAYYPAKGLGQLNSDFLKYVCLFTLVLAARPAHLGRLSAIYVSAAAVSSLFGIYEAISPVAAGRALARAGVFMNAVRYGEALTIALLLIVARLVLPDALSRRGRALHALAGGITFGALLLTQARGAYLGLAAGLTAMFIFAPAARRRLALLGAALLALAGVLFAAAPSMRARVSPASVAVSGDFSPNSPATGVNVRLELWKLGYKMLKAHPAVGVGPDNVKRVFKRFHPEPFPEEGVYGTLNNLYVHQAAERGLLGLGALLLMFGAALRFSLSRFRASGSAYALWAPCALAAFFVVNLTEISFQHVHTSFAVFLAMAFGAAANKGSV